MFFSDGGLTGQLGQVLGGLHSIGGKGALDMTVRSNAFIVTIAGFTTFKLVDVLANQITLDTVAGNKG